MKTVTYEDLKQALRRDDLAGDPWGTTVATLMDVCEELTFYRHGAFEHVRVPDAWGYRPSPLGAISLDERSDVGQYYLPLADIDALQRFGSLLNRYCDRLRHAGKDY